MALKKRLIPAGWPNRPGLKLWGGTPDWLIIHETANVNAGANAAMHNRFLIESRGGEQNVSFQFVVDDHEIWQNLPLDEVAWQAGDGYYGEGNRDGLATEICVNRDGNFSLAVSNAARLNRALMQLFGLPISRVGQHNRFSSYGKDCPHFLREAGGAKWRSFIAELGSEPAPVPQPQPGPDPEPQMARFYRETQHSVGGSILRFFDKYGGVPQFGYPLTEEKRERLGDGDGKEYTVQYFERARLEWHGGSSPDVMVGRLGAELLQKRGEVAAQSSLISTDFRAFYDSHGGLQLLGLPWGAERDETLSDGKTYRVQYTERARLERHPEAPEGQRVMLGRLGAEGLAAN